MYFYIKGTVFVTDVKNVQQSRGKPNGHRILCRNTVANMDQKVVN